MNLKRSYHRLRFFVSDALDEWRHSPGLNLLATGTLASTLFLAGLLILILSNVENRVERLREDVRLELYLEEGIPSARVAELEGELRADPGVTRVVHVDKQQALQRYRTWAGNTAELIEDLETNPLPASIEVFLAPGQGAEELGAGIASRFGQQSGIEEVRFDRDWLRRLESLLALARLGGTGLAVLVFAAVVFVMASVLRLAVYSRRDEIEIMMLVGATPSFVRGPFLVAGLGQGLLSSGLALLMVEGVRRAAMSYSGAGSLVLLELTAARPLGITLSLLIVAIGVTVSLTGSWFAVRKKF